MTGADTEVLMAGFGGQGMLLAGKVLAQASMEIGREVSWLPSYGPEMRGGTANVMVCIASAPIGSPLIERPRGLIAIANPIELNLGFLRQFGRFFTEVEFDVDFRFVEG